MHPPYPHTAFITAINGGVFCGIFIKTEKENDIMTVHPEITVLTIVYNGERFIREAIDSILNQTYKGFEYVIVDNNSTDNTPAILKDYTQKDRRIKIIREPEQGILYARNAGLKVARGEWIAVLDADDIALSDRLERQLNLVRENPDVVLVGSGLILVDENGKFIKRYSYPGDHKSLLSRLENKQAFFAHSAAFFKKSVVSKLGGYRILYGEDYDLWLRLSIYGEIACVQEPLIKLRRSVMSHSYGVSQESYILLTLAALVCHFLRKEGLTDPSLAKEDEWSKFLARVRMQAGSLNVFQKGKAKRELYRTWYSKENGKLCRVLVILHQLISNRFARGALLDRSYLRNAAVRITEEIKPYLKYDY